MSRKRDLISRALRDGEARTLCQNFLSLLFFQDLLLLLSTFPPESLPDALPVQAFTFSLQLLLGVSLSLTLQMVLDQIFHFPELALAVSTIEAFPD